jgi:hypothetical protein
MEVLGPQVVRVHLGGAGTWAAFGVALGLGGLIGGMAILAAKPRRPIVTAGLLWTIAAAPQFALAFIAPRPVVIVAAFGAGLGITTGNVLWETTLQRRIPPAALSRVSSYDWMVSLVLFPIGLAGAGPLSESIGVRETLIIGGVLIAAAGFVIAALPAVRAVRDE